MRHVLSAAVCAVVSVMALAACGKIEPAAAATDGGASVDDAHAGHGATAMDESMKAADKADDGQSAVTPDNYMFHTYPKKIEIVRLPAGDGLWAAHGYAPSDLFKMLGSTDEMLANAAAVHTLRFEMLASGNGRVVFERRATANPDDPVLEVRTVSFMIH
jgi:hypothetical protein